MDDEYKEWKGGVRETKDEEYEEERDRERERRGTGLNKYGFAQPFLLKLVNVRKNPTPSHSCFHHFYSIYLLLNTRINFV
jgi:hypothetical protein